MEKRNGVKKHIRKLFLSGVLTSDPYEILNGQKQFYLKLYQSNKSELNKNCLDTFFNEDRIPKLSEELKCSYEGKITVDEATKALDSFKANKAPGNDGIPAEFYKKFWSLLKEPMVLSFSEAFEKGEMSVSQRQAIISLLEKEGKDRCYLDNWRPIYF